jgi:hypothetical protein
MHHFIYPSQDTYITNRVNYNTRNFGLDEILVIGTDDRLVKTFDPIRRILLNNETVVDWCVNTFSGSLVSASFNGTASYISGSGSGTGSIGTASFSGSSVLTGSNFSGSVTNFFGTIADFGGHLTAIATGTQSISQSHEVIVTTRFLHRALVKFDINTISASVATGDIQSPQFHLKLKVARAENLPISYKIYALPISQSWEMGNGYASDGGSAKGASWNYRNYYSGSVWYPITDTGSFSPIDYIGTASNAPAVWSRGGATWYTSSIASQSFNYEAGDINMDVSNIVYGWMSGSFQNEGFLLVTSEELEYTGSEMALSFFSKDTNTIYQPTLDVGWNDVTWITGSISTASVTITTLPAGLLGQAQSGSTISSSLAYGGFNGTVNLVTTSSGALTAVGYYGSVSGSSFYGNMNYVTSSSYVDTVTSSFLLGTLTSGYFSSSIFTASISTFRLTAGQLTGSWNVSQLSASTISASYPFDIDPNIIVNIYGNYVHGHALGTYTILNRTSGSFTGIMTDGPQEGALVYIPFTGSILTSSFSFTSSVVMESSSLSPTQFNTPFVVVVQDLPDKAKSGNIIRVNVFSREEFPLKNFQRRTQFTQYLTPRYLPTSSYYG